MVNTPIPHSLKSEAKKAAKILREFTMPDARSGPDKLIPAGILAKAKGLAILTVVKAGFLVTARGGSGIVIAKLEDADEDSYCAGWSAPTAIGIAGLGGGFEIGAEVTDFVIILNKKTAVEAFSKGGNLTLGGNFTIAAGPLGRNIEGDVSVRSPAAMYTYSKTKGIFAGISIEGSGLIERKDANRKFYGQDIRAHQILSGDVDPPEECEALYSVLRHHREYAMRAALEMAKEQAYKHRHTIKDKVTQGIAYKLGTHREKKNSPEPHRRSSESLGEKSDKVVKSYSQRSQRTVTTRTTKTVVKATGSKPLTLPPPSPSARKSTAVPSGGDWDTVMAVAEHSYSSHLPCDLSFQTGDKIEVLTRTEKRFDWWEGTVHDKIGIFPANFVRVL